MLGKRRVGRIVETRSLSWLTGCCFAFPQEAGQNAMPWMFGAPGHAYVVMIVLWHALLHQWVTDRKAMLPPFCCVLLSHVRG